MIILITGASHTGKTALAQKLLEKYKYPYFSIDHLKMGLIRTKHTTLTVCDDDELTEYLWPIVREIIKTAIENNQNLIVEGCYIPLNWKNDFTDEYLSEIKFICLVMSEKYITENLTEIKEYGNIIENRIDDDYCTEKHLIEENGKYLNMCKKYNIEYTLIDDCYSNVIERIRDCCI